MQKQIKLKRICIVIMMLGLSFVHEVQCTTPLGSMGGLTFGDPEQDPYWFSIGGDLYLDETLFVGSAQDKQLDFPSGGDIRVAYLNFEGGVGESWSYLLNLNLNKDSSFVREAHLNYAGIGNIDFQIGKIGIPSSLENSTNQSDLMFLETSLLAQNFFPEDDYGLGMGATRTFNDNIMLAGAIYQPRPAPENSDSAEAGNSDHVGQALRLTFAPLHNENEVYHLGAWIRHQSLLRDRNTPNANFAGFSGTPEAQARNTGSLVATGSLPAKSYELRGLEAAMLKGSLTLQAEYLSANVNQIPSVQDPASVARRLHFYAWYIQGGYVVTGESRNYDFKSGTFNRVKPIHDYGALEIALRYSIVNLVDHNIYGGDEHNISIGINWFLNQLVRVSTNYIHAVAHSSKMGDASNSSGAKHKLDIVALRLQISF